MQKTAEFTNYGCMAASRTLPFPSESLLLEMLVMQIEDRPNQLRPLLLEETITTRATDKTASRIRRTPEGGTARRDTTFAGAVTVSNASAGAMDER